MKKNLQILQGAYVVRDFHLCHFLSTRGCGIPLPLKASVLRRKYGGGLVIARVYSLGAVLAWCLHRSEKQAITIRHALCLARRGL